MLTVLEIIKKTTEFFAARGLESPRLNAELLVGHGLGLRRMQLYLQFERPLTDADLEKIRPLVRRRGQREPLQYVLGETEFFGLSLKTDRRALIPRPETERLVELIVARPRAVPPSQILDLGTGTGAIALALAKQYPDARVIGVDRSAGALALATENAERTGLRERVTFLESDWFSALPTGSLFDLIVANPPYLSLAETAATAPEVQGFEPHDALTSSGEDGLDDLRRIVTGARPYLRPGSLLALETGIEQHAVLLALATKEGFVAVESAPDLSGRDRYIFAEI